MMDADKYCSGCAKDAAECECGEPPSPASDGYVSRCSNLTQLGGGWNDSHNCPSCGREMRPDLSGYQCVYCPKRA